MKANHNVPSLLSVLACTVSYGSKDTKMKANHNVFNAFFSEVSTVSYGSKILK